MGYPLDGLGSRKFSITSRDMGYQVSRLNKLPAQIVPNLLNRTAQEWRNREKRALNNSYFQFGILGFSTAPTVHRILARATPRWPMLRPGRFAGLGLRRAGFSAFQFGCLVCRAILRSVHLVNLPSAGFPTFQFPSSSLGVPCGLLRLIHSSTVCAFCGYLPLPLPRITPSPHSQWTPR